MFICIFTLKIKIMKKYFGLLVCFISFSSIINGQSTWENTFYQYNSQGPSQSFQLSNNDCFVHNYSQGASVTSTARVISPNGVVLSEKSIAGLWIKFQGIGDRIYSFNGQTAYKLNKQLDTVSIHTGLPNASYRYLIESNKFVYESNGLSLQCLDSNFSTLWSKTTNIPLNYQSLGINYQCYGGTGSILRDNNGDIIFLGSYLYEDPNYLLADTTSILLLRINGNTGSTIDSLYIGLNYPSYFNGNDFECVSIHNNKLSFINKKVDYNYNIIGQELFEINLDFSNHNIQNMSNLFGGFYHGYQAFQGINNNTYFFKSDSIYSFDNNLNVINSWRLINNTYEILKVDTVLNGYIFKIIDYTDNNIKFIRTDINFQHNSCNSNAPFNEDYSVCQVTVNNNHCNVIWEESGSSALLGYCVYKENALGSYDSLTYIPVDSLSEYLDLSSTPSVSSQKYKITYLDTCLRESPLSNFHRTIHLTANIGVNNEVNLIWTSYVGTNYNTYYIYRGTSPNNLTVLDSVSSSILSYTDFTAPVGVNLYYEIIIQPSNTCTSTKSIYSSIKSNTKSTVETNSIQSLSVNDYDIYPNPTDADLHINSVYLKNQQYTIFDIMGIKVSEGQLNESHSIISLKELSSGSYLLLIGNNNIPRRIIKK